MVTLVRQGDTFYAQRGSYFDGNVKIDGNFVVPPRTHFWGRLAVAGRLELGPRSTVALGITCGSAIIGSNARIKGPVTADGDVTVLDNAVIHEIRAGGNVTLRTGVHVGDVTAGEALVIHGKIKSKKLVGKTVKVLGD
ncbi:MAG TPA: polymer-forming cytoskeletal protein [Methanoregulaceae archaeon]|nr:polymer-forming cytoskeletal protein [Methanoregulaceae archaeon]HPD74975.1 polymer-forming cytoskeletal protein [Methanoregulaceae archaeon]HRY75222.1 polymer-forming cytoskeletal protein [Methanoregulaceae archaeon]